ncbi:MAG TPA: family 43 glycosylhydrolase [Lacunisphaera sp.]|nr:family 43 glycosylhydrolase [Lacunisphaera sp.]
MKSNVRLAALLVPLLAVAGPAFATNPLIMDQFTADPTARVFEGKVYLYPSHDILATPGKGRPDWFNMEDYHAFSSENLTDWTDHGVIVSQTGVAWAKPDAYALWAPDCVSKDGKYYFYFPAVLKEGKGFGIGVAIADRPEGPFKPEPNPIAGVRGIDPCVLLDRDGSAYLFYGARKIFAAKLKPNLLELDGPPAAIDNLPTQGLLEGPFAFARNGVYYLTYPHVENKTERIEYAMSDHPLGPYKPAGVLMDESPTGCWTIQQSIVEYRGEWYLFYHDRDLSPNFDKARSVRADRVYFNTDGTMRKVVRTLRGVGVVGATEKIQLDRYSAISDPGIEVEFLDPSEVRQGWKISLPAEHSWVRFNEVDFGSGGQKMVVVRATSRKGGAVEIHADAVDGPLLGRVAFGASPKWQLEQAATAGSVSGVRDLFVVSVGTNPVDLDWLRFE